MNESIKQGLIMTVAGILFCLAVTMLMMEMKAVADMGRAVSIQTGAVRAEGAEDLCTE